MRRYENDEANGEEIDLVGSFVLEYIHTTCPLPFFGVLQLAGKLFEYFKIGSTLYEQVLTGILQAVQLQAVQLQAVQLLFSYSMQPSDMLRMTYTVKARDAIDHVFEKSYPVNAPASITTPNSTEAAGPF